MIGDTAEFAQDVLCDRAGAALGLEPHRVRSLYIGRNQTDYWTSDGGASVLLPIPEKIEEIVARLYAPPAQEDVVAARSARVQVMNGTTQPYLGHIAADQLRWAGFEVAGIGSAERVNYGRTWIHVYNEKPQALAELARLLDVREKYIVRQPDPDQEDDMLVILGADYDPCQ